MGNFQIKSYCCKNSSQQPVKNYMYEKFLLVKVVCISLCRHGQQPIIQVCNILKSFTLGFPFDVALPKTIRSETSAQI